MKLTWRKSAIEGYVASHGDVMFWDRGDLFPEETTAWVSFRAARTSAHESFPTSRWTLLTWTHDALRPSRSYWSTLAQCKEVATLITEALAKRYDGENVAHRDMWLVTSFIEDTERAVALWVEYPEQRDSFDVKRLAAVGIERTL